MKHVLANETARISIIVGVIKFVTSSQLNNYIPGLYIVTIITKKSTKDNLQCWLPLPACMWHGVCSPERWG